MKSTTSSDSSHSANSTPIDESDSSCADQLSPSVVPAGSMQKVYAHLLLFALVAVWPNAAIAKPSCASKKWQVRFDVNKFIAQ